MKAVLACFIMMRSEIKLREIQCLSKIMNCSINSARHRSLSTNNRYNIPSSNKYQVKRTDNRDHFHMHEPQIQLSRDLTLINIKLSQSSELKNSINYQLRQPKDKFCGDLVVSKKKRPVFRHVVQKYKRSYHPTNASRGNNDTSNQCVREPKKSKIFRESLKESRNQSEIRYMSILSKVINENNRRQARVQRQQSLKMHKSLI